MHTQENQPASGSGIVVLTIAVVVIGIGLGGGVGIAKLISPKEVAQAEDHDTHGTVTEVAHAGTSDDSPAPFAPAATTIELAKPGDPMPASMTTSDCLACHQVAIKVVGPSYQQVADKYRGQPDQIRKLARKVIQGGVGVWGEIPMAPHPQHTFEQAQEMVAWILGQTTEPLPPASDTETVESDAPAGS